MRKTKVEKGITLVALVITIAVLILLAVVAITAVNRDEIIGRAESAAQGYTIEQAKELVQMTVNEHVIEKNLGQITQTLEERLMAKEWCENAVVANEEATIITVAMNVIDIPVFILEEDGYTVLANEWAQSGTLVTNGKVIAKVGEYINYLAGVDGYTDANGWRVLGVENGQLLILSSNHVVSSYELLAEYDKTVENSGYANGVTALNNLCADYGKGLYATGARSINADDINRITKYDPTTFKKGEIGEYGSILTFKIGERINTEKGGNCIDTTCSNGTSDASQTDHISFTTPTGEVLGENETISIKTNYYSYKVGNYLSADSLEYDMLLKNEENNWIAYWVATYCEEAEAGRATWGIRRLLGGGELTRKAFNYSNDPSYLNNGTYGVRAVVSLDKEITLTQNSVDGSWDISKNK